MGTPNPALEIQGKFQEAAPYAWGLYNVDSQGGLVDVDIHLGVKPRRASIIQANAITAPDIRKQGKALTLVFPFFGLKYLHWQPLKMKL